MIIWLQQHIGFKFQGVMTRKLMSNGDALHRQPASIDWQDGGQSVYVIHVFVTLFGINSKQVNSMVDLTVSDNNALKTLHEK